MSTPLLPDALWNLIQPLLPSAPPKPKGGRPRLPDRSCLSGVSCAAVYRGRKLFQFVRVWGWQTGPNPTDRAKLRSKRHLISDGRRVPQVMQLRSQPSRFAASTL
jgi:transposase